MGMNLIRLANKTWGIRFSRKERPPHGGKISLRSIVGHPVYDKKKAEDTLRLLKKNFHKLKIEQLTGHHRTSLAEFITDYTTGERQDLAFATLRMDSLALRSLGDVTGHKRAVGAITNNDLIRFKNICLDRGMAPDTVKSYLRHIKAALNWAVKNGYRSRPVEIPKVKTKKTLPKVIPPDTLAHILTWAGQNDFQTWRYALFAVSTGCRQNELVTLSWQTVTLFDKPDPEGIYGSAVVTGKGDKERTIYLIKDAVDALGPTKDIGPVFCGWTGWTISKYFKRAARAVGQENIHFHMLRHTAATNMIDAGLNIRVIQEILGHTDIKTTLRYAKVTDKTNHREMGKLAQLRGK